MLEAQKPVKDSQILCQAGSTKMCYTEMWSRSRRLGLETVSRRINVSSRSRLGLGPMRFGSRLGLGAICLGLGSVGLVSGLGPLRLVETFFGGARRAYCSCS